MRKLASIQRVVNIEPIEGADKVVKATILGWEVVCKKDEFKIGDIGVYCEVDSILPERKEFEFLRERKFRIKTIKLRGQVSQGIFFPLSVLPKGKYSEGDDVTDLLGVIKYESPTEKTERVKTEVSSNRITKFMKRYAWYRQLFLRPAKADFPKFIRKTDEDRIQLFPHICEEHKDTLFQITEKVDGQSATYFIIPNPHKWMFWKKWIFGVCSRNFHLIKEDNSTWWRIARDLRMKEKLMSMAAYDSAGLYIQGEIVGEGIQSNKYSLKGITLMVFNVVYLTGAALDNNSMKYFCQANGLPMVPEVSMSFKLKETIRANVELAKGQSVIADVPREGLVVRNYRRNISFKIINPDFLLKYDI